MSSNTSVNYLLGAVVGIGVALVAPYLGVAFLANNAMFAGVAAFGLASSFLNGRYATPAAPTQKPQDFSNAGRVFSGRDAAARQLEVNSATEAVPIPVVFGTVRLGANHIRYDAATFRTVPIIERIQKAKEAVAYALARDTYRTRPAVVDREIDESAKKSSGSGGKGGGKSGGGKGGAPSSPPPSQQFTDAEKINQYTADLLAADEAGTKKLPKEYDERTVGFKYYLTWELGICMGEVSKLHAVRIYPGEDLVIDRAEAPEITTDDTELTGEGGSQGGPIRFYRGSATQTRNVADVYKETYNNYRNVCFAVFDDYWLGHQPTPQSYAFEIERIPVCLDADGDPIAGFELRAGEDTTPITATAADWTASEVTVTAAGHDLAPGDTVFLAGFTPAEYNGTYVVTAVAGDDWTAAMQVAPDTATTFGTSRAPDTASPAAVGAASWSGGSITLDITGHGLSVDQPFTLAGFTPAGYNGNYIVDTTPDADTITAVLASDPGAATVLGTLQAHPMPVNITAATWEGNVATFTTDSDHNLSPADTALIEGMIPTEWNGSLVVIDAISTTEFTATLELDPGAVTVLGTSKKRPDASYGDANPAAILYEVFTNQIWGLGLSPALFDIPSFVAVSQYFAAQRIGMSFALETQVDISSVVEQVRSHVATAVLWLGDRFYCRCILDRSTSYDPRFILTSDSVTEVNITRPAWSAAVNELRATYLDRHNNYQSQIVAAQDDASIATIERTNSRSINLPAFSNRETTETTVQRLLSELAYPQAVLKFKMARGASHIFPTAFVEFRWSEWSAGETTTYWRVSEIADADAEGAYIEVTCVEDIYSTAIAGTSETFTVPVPAYEGMPRTTDADLDFSDVTQTLDFGTITINLHEVAISLSDGDRIFAVFAQKQDGFLHSLAFYYRAAAKGTLTLTALPTADETITVGAVAYTWKASPTTGANEVKIGATIAESIGNLVAAITGGAGSGSAYGSATVAQTALTAAIGTAYAATATLTTTGNPSSGDTVKIGSKTYTIKTTLTPAEGEVLRGASAALTLANLAAAINHTGTPDTDYKCASANLQVTAGLVTATTITITALIPGNAGNLIATTDTGGNWSWGASTMRGGSDRAPNRTAGNENTMLVTATAKGTDGNALATTETCAAAHWQTATLTGGTDYLPIGNVTPWAITGTLVAELATGLSTTRDGTFEIQLDNPSERARFLTYCSTAPTDADGLEVVAGAQTNWLVIGDEFIQIAQAEAGSQSNRVRCTAYIRNQYGSEQATHAAGTPASFVYDFVPYDNSLRYDQIPIDEEVEIQVIPSDRRGLTGTAQTFLHTFAGTARKPLRITTISTSAAGLDYTVTYRPRWHNRGAEMHADLEADLASRAIEIPTGYETYVMPVNVSGKDLLDNPAKVAVTFTPEADDDATSGMIEFTYTCPATTTALTVYQSFNGVLGLPTTTAP